MKEYVKPELYYESFELSQHIAACYFNLQNNPTDVNSCAMPDTLFFASTNAACTSGEPEGYCYTNGSTTFNVFNS